MKLLATFKMALEAMAANKLRAFLTILGVVIGVSAVISLMSVGRGSQAAITQRIEGLGVRGAAGGSHTLTLEDARALADPVMAPAVVSVAPELSTRGQVLAGGANVNAQVLGVTPEYPAVRNYSLLEGQFITEGQVTGRSSVAVLGYNVADTLFGGVSVLGQRVRINQYPFTVIGVLEKRGTTAASFEDDVVMVPISTAAYRLTRTRTVRGALSVQNINVQARSESEIEVAKTQVTEILRERHQVVGEDDFTVTSQQDILQARQEIANVLTIFLGSIAAISLLVGGIGIMNIMLVSVVERTREIGIRKALGAKRHHILTQFIMEATALSFVGGAMGLLAGWGISKLLAGITLHGQQVQTLVTADIVALAIGVSVSIGLFFGIFPAIRAARMDPIEALRHE